MHTVKCTIHPKRLRLEQGCPSVADGPSACVARDLLAEFSARAEESRGYSSDPER